MEAVIFEDSPLAEYLEGEGDRTSEWISASAQNNNINNNDDEDDNDASSTTSSSPDAAPPPPPPPLSFAPRGLASISSRFRHKQPPPPLRMGASGSSAGGNGASSRGSTGSIGAASAVRERCSAAVNARLGRADNARFLEQFRYALVASQLLSHQHQHHQTYLGQAAGGAGGGGGGGGAAGDRQAAQPAAGDPAGGGGGGGEATQQLGSAAPTLAGAALTAAAAFLLVWLLHWARGGRTRASAGGRVALVALLLLAAAAVAYTYFRRQWLCALRRQTVGEAARFVDVAHGFDAVAAASLTLVQEVELVSRGYRISNPLPPVSRLDDRSQTRRCARLRKALLACFREIIPRYDQSLTVLKHLAEEPQLEKYYDMYDLGTTDLEEASLGFSEKEFDDFESLRVLKILSGRFHIIRKLMICCLLATDANGGKQDFGRWGVVAEEIQATTAVANAAEERLREILSEEENFPVPATPKVPLTPGRERWRVQLRKLNSLSSGIRGLQAKLHLLREESSRTLHESEDNLSDLTPDLLMQYDSVGVDLRGLVHEWEEGRAALAASIDRKHKRMSSLSLSGVLSPTSSIGGLTAVDEAGGGGGGSPLDALKSLNGEEAAAAAAAEVPRSTPSSLDSGSSDAEEVVFEAVAAPPRQRPRSTMTRDERIAKMREDRARKLETARERSEAASTNTHMLRELESVINLRPRARPRGKTTTAAASMGRITSI